MYIPIHIIVDITVGMYKKHCLVFVTSLLHFADGNAVPAWAISLMAGIGMLVIGGVIYVIMRKMVLSSETGSLNTYQPALQNEDV